MRRLLMGIAVLAMASTSYDDSIRAWQQHRDAGLRAPDGWLTLVGLFWLKPGANTIESAAGTFHLQGDKITFTDSHGAQKNLSYDEQNPTIVQTGTVSFSVIK